LNFNVIFKEGFYPQENNKLNYINWCDSVGRMIFSNHSSQPKKVVFHTNVITPGGSTNANVYMNSTLFVDTIKLNKGSNVLEYTKSFQLPPGKSYIYLSTDAVKLVSFDRSLYFGFNNFTIEEVR